MNQKDLFVLLNIPDDGSCHIDKIIENENVKTVFISRPPHPVFCPECGSIMHSRGLKHRTVNHPILQDGTTIILDVAQRRWKCTGCSLEQNESYPFLQRYRHSTSVTPLLVLNAMKDLNRTAVSVAQQFHLSDSTVHDIFSQYVDLKRLPLTSYISIDEVYMDISDSELYAFIIMDFVTGQIIDIVHNRWSSTLESYFSHIPRTERENVKGIISDAYGPYQSLCDAFFPNASPILDSFHVIKYINSKITVYINSVLKKYRKLQENSLENKNTATNSENKTIKDSDEIILLRDYRWIILKNRSDIFYSPKRFYQKKLHVYLDTWQLEKHFLDLDENFEKIRDLKEMYITFNSSSFSDSQQIYASLDNIISVYRQSSLEMFHEVADLLASFKDNIVLSFTTVECSRKTKKDQMEYYSRLSNGPMESFNRKPKDYKRNARGFSNFDYTRNRILWSTRIDPPILAVPKPLSLIHSYHKKNKK